MRAVVVPPTNVKAAVCGLQRLSQAIYASLRLTILSCVGDRFWAILAGARARPKLFRVQFKRSAPC